MYDYAIIRVVPRVEREEFVNAGAIVSCGSQKFLAARISLNEQCLIAIDPTVDLESQQDRSVNSRTESAFTGLSHPEARLSKHRGYTLVFAITWMLRSIDSWIQWCTHCAIGLLRWRISCWGRSK
jgi:hypothetical protein